MDPPPLTRHGFKRDFLWSNRISPLFVGIVIGVTMSNVFTPNLLTIPTTTMSEKTLSAPDRSDQDQDPPQIHNFMKEQNCRSGGHLSVPALLKTKGDGKVYVDVGLDAGEEFFAALSSGYSVYGFEANPLSAATLRKKCEDEVDNCKFVNGSDIAGPLPPVPRGGYLIHAGAGAKRAAMNISLGGPASSFAEKPPYSPNADEAEVTILPLSTVVDVDVFFLKIDVQGFEFEVLRGAKRLFDERIVKTMLMEVYPRGLSNAGVDHLELLHFLWYNLGLMCSTSLPTGSRGSFKVNHATSLTKFAEYLETVGNRWKNDSWFGEFDDFYCFNRRKLWKWD